MKTSRLLGAVCACLFIVSFNAGAALIANIHNGPASNDGTTQFLDVSTLTTQLVFSNLILFAQNEINVIEHVDLSSSTFGTPSGSLGFSAPVVNINFNLSMGLGPVVIEGATFNFNNSILDSSLILGSGTTMSLSNSTITGDLQVDTGSQAIISGGQLGANLIVGDTASVELVGSDFELNVGSGFVSVGSGILTDSNGLLRGTLASGELFEVDFTQTALTSSIILTTVPVPAAIWLFGSGLLGLIGIARRKKT